MKTSGKLSVRTLDNRVILVCGGAGFIGSNFIRHVFENYKNVRIINFDKLTYSGNLDNVKDIKANKSFDYTFVKGDIADSKQVKAVFRKHKPHYVINFAAETHVDRSIHGNQLEFIKTNIEGVFNLLEAVKASKDVVQFVQVSTDEVHGSLALESKKKFNADTKFAPNAPYAATKCGGDLLCRAYHSTWKVPVIVTHCSNNYGPFQYPEKIIPYFITRMLESKKVPLYGDGKYVRDWIYVIDHCRALDLCLLSGKSGEVYHIGDDNEVSNIDLARRIVKYFGRDESWIEYVQDRPGHDRRYAIDSSKIKRELGWKPEYGFDQTLQDTIAWYVENPKWIANIRKKAGSFNPHIDRSRRDNKKPLAVSKSTK